MQVLQGLEELLHDVCSHVLIKMLFLDDVIEQLTALAVPKKTQSE
jgi:hypothetical protein